MYVQQNLSVHIILFFNFLLWYKNILYDFLNVRYSMSTKYKNKTSTKTRFIPDENEDEKCAPDKEHTDGSCFTFDALKRMCIAYNKQITKGKINEPLIEEHEGGSKRDMVKALTKRLEHVCDDQICWLKQDFIKEMNDEEINDGTLRPQMNQGRYDWLSNVNVDKIMKQYENKYSDYKYLGTVPIDFSEINKNGIRTMNLDSVYNSGKKKLGMVINLDEHWQNGSHWVALYSDLEQGQVYYFDSYGIRPRGRVREFVGRLSKWCYKQRKGRVPHESESFMKPSKQNKIEKELEVQFNKVRHQFKGSECGVYSTNFILRLLKGETFDYICDNITDDDTINECRTVYFRFK
jgi:hypothetical protein